MSTQESNPPRTRRIILLEWLQVATLAFVPLAVNPWGFNYSLPKVVLFRALTLLALGAHLVTLAWRGRPLRPRRWLRRPLTWPVLLIGGVTLLSTTGSISPLTSLWGTYQRHQGAYLTLCAIACALLTAAHLRSPARRRRLGTVIGAAGSLVALTPFIESAYYGENVLTWRPGGSLGNPIFLGAYLIMTLPFTLALLIERVTAQGARSAGTVLWAIGLILQSLALLVTQSRGPWLGAAAGAAIFAALMVRSRRRRWLLAGLLALVLAGGALTVGLSAGTAPAERLSQLPYARRVLSATDLSRGTVRVRIVLWQAAARVVTRWPMVGLESDPLHPLRPAIGYGPDTASIVYTANYPPELAHIEDASAIWDRAHNELLDVLTMEGWLGLIAWAVLAIVCLRQGLRRWRAASSLRKRAWIAAPLAALGAHLVEIQFAFSVTATVMMGWFCVGWLAAEPEADWPALADPRRPSGTLRWRVYAGVAATLIAVGVLLLEGGALAADVLVARARGLDRAKAWQASIAHYDRALNLIPWQATYHQFRAEAFYNLARALPEEANAEKRPLFQAAERSLSNARRLEPLEMEHYANSGILHATWSEALDEPSHLTMAVELYEKAIRLAPTRIGLYLELGHIYHNHALYAEALAQYQAALVIDPQSGAAYYDAGLAWQKLGRTAEAADAFQAALEIAPDCEPCREALETVEEELP